MNARADLHRRFASRREHSLHPTQRVELRIDPANRRDVELTLDPDTGRVVGRDRD